MATGGGVSLALSLLFGVGQIAAGAAVVWRLLPRRPWRSAAPSLLFALCLWFMWSGVTELAVSGMEVARAAGGGPGTEEFAAWRGRADTALWAVTAALIFSLLARPLLVRVLIYATGPRRKRQE